MPPPVAAEVAVNQFIDPLALLEELPPPHPAASTTLPRTTAKTAPFFVLSTFFPSDLHDHVGSGRSHRREGT